MYKEYDDNPLNINTAKLNIQIYEDLAEKATAQPDFKFLETVENEFGYLIDDEFIHDLALVTQIVLKLSAPLYLHGYLLYAAIRQYLHNNKRIKSVNILETGTARGFSALMMAKALDDAKRIGKILTIDILPPNKAIYWNCIQDIKGPTTRFQLLNKWQKLVEEYIIFLQGYSDVLLSQIELSRIHAAFLDGGHDYQAVKCELNYLKSHQKKGDIIVCDDYTQKEYPALVSAVNEFLSKGDYMYKIYRSSSGRGYVYFKKK
jgi:cephalosporin hydroxylase